MSWKSSVLYTPKRIWIVVLTMKYISSFLLLLRTRTTCSSNCFKLSQTTELFRSFLRMIFTKKSFVPYSTYQLKRRGVVYSLFTWKINQAERLNNIIQASREGATVFSPPLSLSLASKQPSLIVWKVSWLNVNCTTPLYVWLEMMIWRFFLWLFIELFLPRGRAIAPRPETETGTVHHSQG